MSDIIQLLPDHVANQIAAGEVVQRPASIVKELLENAIDAGATKIELIIEEAGRNLIKVADNGSGMSETDARMAFERHATSKIRTTEDIFHIATKGFRGEALASIAAVAQVELKTNSLDVTAILRQTAFRHKVPARRICFDATGSGEHLRGDLANAIPFVGASAAIDTTPENKTQLQQAANRKQIYANLRAQCFARSGKRVDDCGIFFAVNSLHLQEMTTEELRAIRKAPVKEGAPMLIIPKADIKQTLKRSPGIADVISMREIFDLLPYKQNRRRQVRAG